MRMSETTEEEIRRQIFDLLNSFSVDASEVSNGMTYVSSNEARTLTEGILDIIRTIGGN